MTGLITIVRNDDDPPSVERIPRADVRKVSIRRLTNSQVLTVIAFGIMQPYELPWSALADDAQRASLYADVVANLEIDVTWTLACEKRTRWDVLEIAKMVDTGWQFGDGDRVAYRWHWVRTEQRPS